MGSFYDDATAQLEILQRQIEMARDKGYMILQHGFDLATENELTIMNGGMAAQLRSWMEEWSRRAGRRPFLVLNVIASPSNQIQTRNLGKRHVDETTALKIRVPKTRRYAVIVNPLNLMAKRRKGRAGEVTGAGFLLASGMSDSVEYTGMGPLALRAIVATLNTPAARAAMIEG